MPSTTSVTLRPIWLIHHSLAVDVMPVWSENSNVFRLVLA
jgi:hypothetical protein